MKKYDFTISVCSGKCAYGDSILTNFEVTDEEYSILQNNQGEALDEVEELADLYERVYTDAYEQEFENFKECDCVDEDMTEEEMIEEFENYELTIII